ncbi:MAG: hypothetical protein KKB51_04615 [Candidatus Riflebacteria bacterium]|nr:hypothetical protein [Candidatus Riflebacteria bacterium]
MRYDVSLRGFGSDFQPSFSGQVIQVGEVSRLRLKQFFAALFRISAAPNGSAGESAAMIVDPRRFAFTFIVENGVLLQTFPSGNTVRMASVQATLDFVDRMLVKIDGSAASKDPGETCSALSRLNSPMTTGAVVERAPAKGWVGAVLFVAAILVLLFFIGNFRESGTGAGAGKLRSDATVRQFFSALDRLENSNLPLDAAQKAQQLRMIRDDVLRLPLNRQKILLEKITDLDMKLTQELSEGDSVVSWSDIL